MLRAGLRCPRSTLLLQSEQGLHPQPLLTGLSAPAPKHWGGLCWTCCGWPMSILFRGLQTGSHSTAWLAEKSCFCWSGDQAPIHTAGRLLPLPVLLPGHDTSSCSCWALGPLQQNRSPARHSPVPRTSRGTSFPGTWLCTHPLEFHEGFQPPHSCSLSRSPWMSALSSSVKTGSHILASLVNLMRQSWISFSSSRRSLLKRKQPRTNQSFHRAP